MRNVILLAGRTGNIGSHTVVDLLKRGKSVLILDNLCNCSSKVRVCIGAIWASVFCCYCFWHI